MYNEKKERKRSVDGKRLNAWLKGKVKFFTRMSLNPRSCLSGKNIIFSARITHRDFNFGVDIAT